MSSRVDTKSPMQEAWATVVSLAASPVAAGGAVVPVFYGFMAKSAQQLGNPVPSMPPVEVLKAGVKAAPTIALIVGMQTAAQSGLEKAWLNGQAASPFSMLLSAAAVGAVSAHGLAMFNAQSMGQSPLQAAKDLSFKQGSAIVTRETSFLLALRIAGPVSEAMQRQFGKNKAVDYASAFTTGVIGSVVGHPADAALTLWQKGMPVTSISQLMRGAPARALAVGGFSVCYKTLKECIEATAK